MGHLPLGCLNAVVNIIASVVLVGVPAARGEMGATANLAAPTVTIG